MVKTEACIVYFVSNDS